MKKARIQIKRIHEAASPEDGQRILVDRLWPRGISREKAALDGWRPELAPSNGLRTWFGHDEQRWGEFRKRYLAELRQHREEARELAHAARSAPLTLLYAARNPEHNNAIVLRQYLMMLERPGQE